jgi:ABC-2 type transport system ATP-binding protein
MISLSDFSKSYHNIPAVEHITFSAGAGKVTVLLGPNGAGKTTIIKALFALHFATSGTVTVDDASGFSSIENEVHRYDAAENPDAVHALVGYVPEQPLLYNDFTISEFLYSVAMMHGFSKKKAYTICEYVIAQCSLSYVLSKKISTLSKGYLQRVLFAQALISDPPNIVLDEPINGLDPGQITQMRSLIKKLAKTKTIIMSTHLMQEVEVLDPNILIISKGHLVVKGTEQEIIANCHVQTLEQAFLQITGGINE